MWMWDEIKKSKERMSKMKKEKKQWILQKRKERKWNYIKWHMIFKKSIRET